MAGGAAAVGLLLLGLALSGCASLARNAAFGVTDGLSAAILDSDDPQLVGDGLPAYLILLDALVRSDPANSGYLGAATQLYAAYGIAFVDDADRAKSLTEKARDYGRRALCAAQRRACDLDRLDYDAYAAVIDETPASASAALYSYCVGYLAYIRSHSEDWGAVAALPRVEHALEHLQAIPGVANASDINMYLGILNTLRPAALGGKPELGQAYFEKAIALSGGRNLAAKVEYARGYARLVYDRELYDRLLQEVLASPARQEGLTLFNTLAQRQARQLLAQADDYF